MSEELHTLLHERADQVAFDAVDLTAVTTAGRRQVRRRRLGVVSASVAAVVAIGAGGVLVGTHQGGHHDNTEVATDGIPTTGVAWASGSTLHVGSGTFDVGHRIVSLVRTAAGYVFTDPDGAVWSAHGGSVTQVGSVSTTVPHLVGSSDPSGTLAGWVDQSQASPAFALLDQSTGQVTRDAGGLVAGEPLQPDDARAAYLVAIDGRTAYWHDATGYVAHDVDGGATTSVAPPANGHQLIAVRDGRQLWTTDQFDVVVAPDGTTVPLVDSYGGAAAFSPDGRWVSVDADDPHVYDARTGRRTPLGLDVPFATGYAWLDDGTLLLVSMPAKNTHFQITACTVSDAACRIAVPDLGSGDGDKPVFALPVGDPIGG